MGGDEVERLGRELPGPPHAGETGSVVQLDDAAVIVLGLDAAQLIHGGKSKACRPRIPVARGGPARNFHRAKSAFQAGGGRAGRPTGASGSMAAANTGSPAARLRSRSGTASAMRVA